MKTRRESIKEFALQILLLIALCAALLAVGIPLILFFEWLAAVTPPGYLSGGFMLLMTLGYVWVCLARTSYGRFVAAYAVSAVFMVLILWFLLSGIFALERFLFSG